MTNAPAKPFDWTMLTRIVLSVITFGWGWLTGNQDIVLAFVASLLVWLVSLAVERGYNIGKAVKTVFLFVVSVALSLLFTPVDLPPFPGWDQITEYLGAIFVLVDTVLAAATVIYNLLLAEILKQVPNWVMVLRR